MDKSFEKLMEELQKRSTSLNELSAMTGIPVSTLCSAKNANKPLSFEHAIKIGAALDIDPLEFVEVYKSNEAAHSARLIKYMQSLSANTKKSNSTFQTIIRRYHAGPLMSLLSLLDTPEDANQFDQLIRMYLSMDNEGRGQMFQHAKIVHKDRTHASTDHNSRLKGIHSWNVLQRKSMSNK